MRSPDEVVQAVWQELDSRLSWNVRAYGKAWTGEGEDTSFLLPDAIIKTAIEERDGEIARLRDARDDADAESSRLEDDLLELCEALGIGCDGDRVENARRIAAAAATSRAEEEHG